MSRPTGAVDRADRVRPRRLGAAVVLAACAAACTGAGGPSDGAGRRPGVAARVPPADTAGDPADLAAILRRASATPGDSRAEARARLGPPVETRVETIPNRHVAGAVDTLVRMRWEGLTARYHRSGANQREFLASVDVTGGEALRALLAPGGLTRRAGLRGTLGRPDRADDGRWTYVCCPGRRGAEESLVFHVEDDSVAGVRASFYVD